MSSGVLSKMNDYTPITGEFHSSSSSSAAAAAVAASFKPVHNNNNDGLRLLPVGWEDEILKISKSIDNWRSPATSRCSGRKCRTITTKVNNSRRRYNNDKNERSPLSSSSSSDVDESEFEYYNESEFKRNFDEYHIASTNKSSNNNNEDDDNPNAFLFNVLKLGFKLALRERDALAIAYNRVVSSSMTSSDTNTSNTTFTMKVDLHNSSPVMAADDIVVPNGFIDNRLNSTNNTAAATTTSSSSSSLKLNNRETEVNNLVLNECSTYGKPVASPKFASSTVGDGLSEVLVEPVDDEDEQGEDVTTWEYRNVELARVPGYGFGIAVSGGRDNPHFKNGDPSIVVSDVLRAGPAFDVLKINDRIVSANGFNLENADYATAVQIMKDSDHLNLIVKRRIRLPVLEYEQRTLKLTLTKPKKKEDFGIVLGCKFYVKEITNKKLAEKDPGLKENDVITSINGHVCDELTLAEARKLLEKSKERLSLIVQRDVPRGTNWKWSSQATLYERLGSETPQPTLSPYTSPLTNSRYSDDGERRLNNGIRRYSNHLQNTPAPPSNDYIPSPPRRQSYSSSRSRTSNASGVDEYGNEYSVNGVRILETVTSTSKELNVPTPSFDSSSINTLQTMPSSSSDPKLVSFLKENGSVGVRVIGGNEVGIYISAVQPGSPAFAQGVRCGNQILRVNDRDMRGMTREDAVLHLLSLTDRVDLVVQYKPDEYEYVRVNNLGDNFFIRVHFNNDKPENGELAFKKGDIFQVIDTLFGGTVGSWQAVSVVNNGKTPTKGVIPNSTRADKLISANNSTRSSRKMDGENYTGSLLRKKMSFGRRSKSLTKNRLDEIVFAQDDAILSSFVAYERVKLGRPEFLRPVVLFGALADVCREKLLQDYPLRFASPQHEPDGGNQKKCGIIRLSSIKEVMNKNKHCLLDITPNSVEKLQYAQYCPIVIFINVDSRARLKELRRQHSKLAAMSSSRQLMEDASKIYKNASYLFTATLDASRQNDWFDGLLDLVSRLQDSQVWMGETRPTNVSDDEFLFPLAYRYHSYAASCESDVESKTDLYLSYGTLPARSHAGYGVKNFDFRRNNNNYADYAISDAKNQMTTSLNISSDTAFNNYYCTTGGDPSSLSTSCVNSIGHRQPSNDIIGEEFPIYENRENFVEHFATFRRHTTNNIPRPKMKPLPPPRHISNHTNTTTSPAPPLAFPYKTSNLNGNVENNGNLYGKLNDIDRSQRIIRSNVIPEGRSLRQNSEPGLYDVKQVLANHAEKACTFSPPPPPPSSNGVVNRNGYVLSNESGQRYSHPSDNDSSYATLPNSPYTDSTRYSDSTSTYVQPIAIINPSFQDSVRCSYEKSTLDRPAAVAVSRTASMNRSKTPNGQVTMAATNNDVTPSTRTTAIPPSPAPRSPHPHSPKLSLTSSTVPVDFNDSVFTNEISNKPEIPVLRSPSGDSFDSSSLPRLSSINETAATVSVKSILNGRTENNTISNGVLSPQQQMNKRPIKSPKPPVPEKPACLTRVSPCKPTNTDFFINSVGGNSAFGPYNKNNRSPSKLVNDSRNVLDYVSATVGPEGATLKSESTGVVLKIPSGALTTRHDIFFKVFQDSHIEPPLNKDKGETLLSPLLMCGPQGLKFQKPVELFLPSSVSNGVDKNERWSFAVKSATATDGNQSNWREIPLLNSSDCSNETTVNGKHVSITIDHF